MAEVKGKFIVLAARLMSLYVVKLMEADGVLFKKMGRHWNELEPEGWYDTALFDLFIEAYAKASPLGEEAIVAIGKGVYPKIKKTVGLPTHLKTPLDFIKYEAEGFLANHRGADIVPRTFVLVEDRHVVVEARAPGYSAKLYEGVFLGILEMCGVKTGKIVQTKSTKRSDTTDEFDIRW